MTSTFAYCRELRFAERDVSDFSGKRDDNAVRAIIWLRMVKHRADVSRRRGESFDRKRKKPGAESLDTIEGAWEDYRVVEGRYVSISCNDLLPRPYGISQGRFEFHEVKMERNRLKLETEHSRFLRQDRRCDSNVGNYQWCKKGGKQKRSVFARRMDTVANNLARFIDRPCFVKLPSLKIDNKGIEITHDSVRIQERVLIDITGSISSGTTNYLARVVNVVCVAGISTRQCAQ